MSRHGVPVLAVLTLGERRRHCDPLAEVRLNGDGATEFDDPSRPVSVRHVSPKTKRVA